MNIFKFLLNRRTQLDVPIDKREKAHKMLDNIIDEPNTCTSWDREYNLNKYIQELKEVLLIQGDI